MTGQSCSCPIERSRCSGVFFRKPLQTRGSRWSVIVRDGQKTILLSTSREAVSRIHKRLSPQAGQDRGLCAHLNLAAPVSQQLTRRRSGRFAVLERELAIHDDRAIATGALHSAPFPAWQIVYDLTRQFALDAELV